MKRTLLVLAVLLGVVSWSPDAEAVYVFHEDDGTKATYVFRYFTSLCPGSTTTFTTSNTTAGGDPVMHLLHWSTEVDYNDDAIVGGTKESRISITVPVEPEPEPDPVPDPEPCEPWDPCGPVEPVSQFSCKPYTVVVRAYDNSTGGDGGKQFDFRVNGDLVGRYSLGGYQINPASVVGPLETIETVLVNDGAPATMLYRFEWNGDHHKLASTNQTWGVGAASKLAGSNVANPSDQLWVIATPTARTREGPTRAIRNTKGLGDADGDGLGDITEVFLCTCDDAANPTACGFDCSTLSNTQDTDGDGLRDDWEVLGEDDATNPLLFPLWGADPLHKDVFVEVDATTSTPVFRESRAKQANSRYASVRQMQNPDGLPGIRLHFDLGFPCTTEPGDQDGISAVCGMFGGANLVTQTSCTSDFGNMNPNRLGRFHWGVENGGGSGAVGGYTFCHNGAVGIVTHELGHNLGLQHWGANWAGIANHKPQYPSMMNYSYTYNPNFTFSDGSRSTPIDPGNVNELATFGSAETDFMTAAPFDYTIDSVTKNIDWNHDGSFDPSVKAHACCRANQTNGGGSDIPTTIANENLNNPYTAVGPAAAAFKRGSTPATYVVVHDVGTRTYRYGYSTQTVGGWSSWASLGPVRHDLGVEPFAAAYDTQLGRRLVIFGGSEGRIRYSLLDANGNHTDPYGNPGGWLGLPTPSGVSFQSVSATVHGPYLYIVTLDTNTNDVWFGALRPDFAFFGWQRAELSAPDPVSSSVLIQSGVTPGAAGARDYNLYVVVKQLHPNDDRVNDIDIYTFDPTDPFDPMVGTWAHPKNVQGGPEVWPDTFSGCQVSGRPAVVFRDHRKGNGEIFTRGALWIYYAVANPACWRGTNLYYRWSWGNFGAGSEIGVDFNMGRWWGAFVGGPDACWWGPAPGTAVALADRDEALTAFTLQSGQVPVRDPPLPPCPAGPLLHVPYADGTGTPTHLLSDHNDYAVIKPGLCRSLNASCRDRCDNPNISCASASTISYDLVDCTDGPM